MLYSSSAKGHGEDRLCWRGGSKDGFQVKSYYRALLPQSVFAMPWKSIWKSKAPPRVAFFVWTAALGRILTTDNLRRRQVIVLDYCWLCKKMVTLFRIFSCIARLRRRSGIFSSAFLGLLGLCPMGFWIFYLAGVVGAEILGLGRHGIWSLFVFSGVFGGREMLGVLRGWRGMCRSLRDWFLERLWSGLRHLEFWFSLLFWIF